MTIKIARGFSLLPDAQTQTFALLAKRGMGKTYAMMVMAEEMLAIGQRTVIVDPVGVCWGLRSSASGKGKGFPILVLGGEHGDLPLEEQSGALVADLVVDDGVSCVLDLSLLRKGAQRRFMTDFAERLYHRNREPLHLILDEADLFAPQRPQRGAERLLGAIEDIVRRGRARGIGVSMATQRAAVLNKDVLTQCETLMLMRLVAPQDRKAMEEWIRYNADDEKRDEVLRSLATLAVGEAWFWSPGWMQVLRRIKIRKRTTFDSSKTPEVGVGKRKAASPKAVAEIDLQEVRERMADVAKRAEENDPKALKKRVRQLERELAKKPEAPEPEVVEVPVLSDGDLKLVADLQRSVEALREKVAAAVGRSNPAKIRPPKPRPASRPRPEVPAREAPSANGLPISAPQHRILASLAFLEGIGVGYPPRNQVAIFASASPKSSSFSNNLGRLRTLGLIDYPKTGLVCLTRRGLETAGDVEIPDSTDGVLGALERRLQPARMRVLRAAVEAHPNAISREDLAEAAGARPSSSAFGNNLGALRSLGLIDYPDRGTVVATELLMI